MKRFRQPHAAVREQYDAYQDGALAAPERTAYQTHLRACAACRSWVAQQEKVISDLQAAMPPPHQLAVEGAAQIQQAMYKQIKRSIFMQNIKLSLRTVAAAVAVVLIAGVVLWWQFGRGDQTTSPTETAVPSDNFPTTDTSEAAEEPVTLTFAAPANQRGQYEIAAAFFNNLNPDVAVQVVPLSPDSDPATQADTAVITQPPPNLQNLVNLSEQLQNPTSINPQDYFENGLQGCQIGETAYGLPLSFSPFYIFYDQTLLAEVGNAPPSADWTWADLVQTITALSSGDGTRYGFGTVDGLLQLLQPLIAANLNENGGLNSAALEPYLQDIVNLVANGHVADVDAAELESLIVFGRVGLWLDDPSTFSPSLIEQSDSLGRLPTPTLGNLSATNLANVSCLTISRGSSQPEAAWRWLQYLALNPPELPANNIPANRLLFAETDESSLSADDPTTVAIGRVWFSSQRNEAGVLLPALRQHVVAGVPLDEALVQIDNNAETTEAEPTAPVIATPMPDSGPTVIRFYGDQFRMLEAADAFHQTHPDIFVDLSISSNARVGAGGIITMADIAEQADCFAWTVFDQLPLEMPELVWDLSLFASPEVLADYAPEALALLQVDDALYGLPLEINPMVVGFNETLFIERGVPLPTAEWTLNEMLNVAAQLGEASETPSYGFVPLSFRQQFEAGIIEMLLLEEGISLWDVAAGTVNLTDPAVTAVFNQYVSWLQQNALYAAPSGEDFEVRDGLVDNGRAALWTTHSGNRPIVVGEPEPLPILPLPQLNSPVLPIPLQTVLFVSKQVEDPTACVEWIEFLTTRADAVRTVPARLSVANGRTWQNDVGAANAAVYREALVRHLAAARPAAGLNSGMVKAPLYNWLGEAAIAAAAGEDVTALLAETQTISEQYLACLAGNSAPTQEEFFACIEQADPD